MMTPHEVAMCAAKALCDKKGENVRLMKVSDITVVADYFLICTGTSNTHVKTLCDEVEKQLTELGEPPLRREGFRSGGWVIIDFGCVIVHIFLDEMRKFYNLERLWADAEEIDISSLLGPGE